MLNEIATTGVSEEQQEFRQNKFRNNAIFILCQIADEAIEFNKAAFIYFINLMEAFDRL
jgi:hypothetical protein